MIPFTLSRVVRLVAAGAAFAAVAAGAAAAADTYAALGDSYSSGVGTASYTLDSACKRGVYAYPYLWTQKHPGSHSRSSRAPVPRRPTCSRARSRR